MTKFLQKLTAVPNVEHVAKLLPEPDTGLVFKETEPPEQIRPDVEELPVESAQLHREVVVALLRQVVPDPLQLL